MGTTTCNSKHICKIPQGTSLYKINFNVFNVCLCCPKFYVIYSLYICFLFRALKGTVSRVAHARLSASRSSHAVISRHYRYGFRIAKSNVFPSRKVNLKAVNASNRGCLCQRPPVLKVHCGDICRYNRKEKPCKNRVSL